MDFSSVKVILGFDQGFSAVKVYSGIGDPFRINNVITEVEETGNLATLTGSGYEVPVYEYEGKKYVVGDSVGYSNISHFREVRYLIKYAPIFLAAAIDRLGTKYGLSKENVPYISAGLPYEYLNDYHAEYRARLKEFEVNGVKYNFEKVFVNYQGVGAFADYFYSWGRAVISKGEQGFVWDIGENTMILIAYEGSSVKRDGSRQYDGGGISGIYDLIRTKIAKRIHREPSITDLRAVVRGKQLLSYGTPVDCADVVDDGIKLYIDNTYAKIMDEYKSRFANCNRVVLAGGGAYLLSNYINSADFAKKGLFLAAPKPEYSNVRGYRLLNQKR